MSSQSLLLFSVLILFMFSSNFLVLNVIHIPNVCLLLYVSSKLWTLIKTAYSNYSNSSLGCLILNPRREHRSSPPSPTLPSDLSFSFNGNFIFSLPRSKTVELSKTLPSHILCNPSLNFGGSMFTIYTYSESNHFHHL